MYAMMRAAGAPYICSPRNHATVTPPLTLKPGRASRPSRAKINTQILPPELQALSCGPPVAVKVASATLGRWLIPQLTTLGCQCSSQSHPNYSIHHPIRPTRRELAMSPPSRT